MRFERLTLSLLSVFAGWAVAWLAYAVQKYFQPDIDFYLTDLEMWFPASLGLTFLGWLVTVVPIVTYFRNKLSFLFNPRLAPLYGIVGALLALIIASAISLLGLYGLFAPLTYYFAVVIGAVSLTLYSVVETYWKRHPERVPNRSNTIQVLVIGLLIGIGFAQWIWKLGTFPDGLKHMDPTYHGRKCRALRSIRVGQYYKDAAKQYPEFFPPDSNSLGDRQRDWYDYTITYDKYGVRSETGRFAQIFVDPAQCP